MCSCEDDYGGILVRNSTSALDTGLQKLGSASAMHGAPCEPLLALTGLQWWDRLLRCMAPLASLCRRVDAALRL